jgi:hypothetical protein
MTKEKANKIIIRLLRKPEGYQKLRSTPVKKILAALRGETRKGKK